MHYCWLGGFFTVAAFSFHILHRRTNLRRITLDYYRVEFFGRNNLAAAMHTNRFCKDHRRSCQEAERALENLPFAFWLATLQNQGTEFNHAVGDFNNVIKQAIRTQCFNLSRTARFEIWCCWPLPYAFVLP